MKPWHWEMKPLLQGPWYWPQENQPVNPRTSLFAVKSQRFASKFSHHNILLLKEPSNQNKTKPLDAEKMHTESKNWREENAYQELIGVNQTTWEERCFPKRNLNTYYQVNERESWNVWKRRVCLLITMMSWESCSRIFWSRLMRLFCRWQNLVRGRVCSACRQWCLQCTWSPSAPPLLGRGMRVRSETPSSAMVSMIFLISSTHCSKGILLMKNYAKKSTSLKHNTWIKTLDGSMLAIDTNSYKINKDQ